MRSPSLRREARLLTVFSSLTPKVEAKKCDQRTKSVADGMKEKAKKKALFRAFLKTSIEFGLSNCCLLPNAYCLTTFNLQFSTSYFIPSICALAYLEDGG